MKFGSGRSRCPPGMGIVTARGSIDGGGGPEFVSRYPPGIAGKGNSGGYKRGPDRDG